MPRCRISVPASVPTRRYFARRPTERNPRAGELRRQAPRHAPAQARLAHHEPLDAPADEPGLDAPARRFYLG
jgi:hypothetical protein